MREATKEIMELDEKALKVIEKRSSAAVEEARGFRVNSQPTYEEALSRRKIVKALMKEIDDTFKPIQRSMDAAKKVVMDQRRKHEEPVEAAAQIYTDKTTKYYQEQERKEIERQRKEREKQEAEAKAIRERAEQEAERLRKQGLEEAAEMRRQAAKEEAELVTSVPVAQVPNKAKTNGSYRPEVWDFEITDTAAVPRQFLMVDEKKLRAYAKSTKGKAVVAGVRFVDKGKLRQR